MDEKKLFAMYAIGIVATLQGIAWACGYNGTVFAFTSLVIGLTVGSILGFSIHNMPPTNKSNTQKGSK